MIATSIDDPYISSIYYNEPIWVALLSDNTKVYMDNNNPIYEETSAWLRLKTYCQNNNLNIKSLTFQFRSNIIKPLPEDAEGYFFRNGLMGFPNGLNIGLFFAGYLKDEKVYITRIGVPEMLIIENEIRDISDEQGVGVSLIRNNK